MTPFKFMFKAIGHHPIKTITIFIHEILQATFTLLIPYAVKNLIDGFDRYDASVNSDIWNALEHEILFFIFIIIGLQVVTRISGTTIAFLSPVFRIKPRDNLVKALQSQPINFFQNAHAGGLGGRVHEVSNGMAMALWAFLFDLTPVFIKVIVGVILFFLNEPFLGMILLIWATFFFTGALYASYRQYLAVEEMSRKRSIITGKVSDMASNIYGVKSFAHESYENKIIYDESKEETTAIANVQIWREGNGYFQSLMVIIVMLTMLYQSVILFDKGGVTLGDVSFILTMLLILTESFRGLAWAVSDFLEHSGMMRDGLKKIYHRPSLVDDKFAQELQIQKAKIVMDDVSFSYPEVLDSHVISHLNLSIPAGQKLGVVGQSGAGKSTLVSLLLRFYDIQSGTINIDGQDISKVTQQSLRRNIAVIPQDTSLFHRTLMENPLWTFGCHGRRSDGSGETRPCA